MSGVNPLIVVIVNLLVDSFDELPDVVEAANVSEFQFEVRVEGLLITILPGTAFAAVGRLCAVACKQ